MEFKTKCVSCETRYKKEIWLFDYCPNCKGRNLICLHNKEFEIDEKLFYCDICNKWINCEDLI